MKILLDTHTLLWWWGQPKKLSRRAMGLLKDPENVVLVSAASALEVAIKTRIGKLPEGRVIIDTWEERLKDDGFAELPIHSSHARRAGLLPGEHRDPFDRILAAQSLIEEIPILGNDPRIPDFGASQIW